MANFFTKRREPFRFMVWLGIAGSLILFAVVLAAYEVRRTGPGWRDVPLPSVFLISTLAMLISSLTLRQANRAFRHERFATYRMHMGTTLALGTLFIILQGWGWQQMVQEGVRLSGNPAGSFVYILSGLHLLHILVGLILLVIAWVEAMRRRPYVEAFVYSVNPPNQLKLRLITLYWHFVDVLWLGLFLFMLLQQGIQLELPT